MNEKLYHSQPKYNVGELIKIRHSSHLALVIELHRESWSEYDTGPYGSGPSFMYKLHFCGEDESDSRWAPEDALQAI